MIWHVYANLCPDVYVVCLIWSVVFIILSSVIVYYCLFDERSF
jgi:hypothetical protein